MQRRTRILWVVGLTVGALGIAFAMNRWLRESPDAFSWDTVTRGEIRETLSASGEIQARTSINIGTSVTGEIKALHVKDGQDVKAGDLLVTIDYEHLKQQLAQAEAALDAARKDHSRLEAAAARARESSDRTGSLFRQGLVADEDYRQARLARENAELSAASAGAQVAQSRANAAGMRDALSKTAIRAPIAGRVTSLVAEMGETAIPGTSNLPGATLMVISDMSEIVAEVKVNESEVVRLKQGQIAQVIAESLPGRVFPGKVYEIASAAEKSGSDANMYKVKVALDMASPDVARLRPGMTARAVILTAEVANAVKVPLQAVLDREGTPGDARKKGLLSPETLTVAMVAKGRRVEERTLRVGIANTQFYEVKAGLAEGERVLTGPIRRLKTLEGGESVALRKKSDTQLEQEAQKKKEPGP